MTNCKLGWLDDALFHDVMNAAFAHGGAPPSPCPKYAPDKVADIRHIRLELSFDLDMRELKGRCATTLAPIHKGVKEIVLDCAELTVDAVSGPGGRALAYDHDGARLGIRFPGALDPGKDVIITVDYHGSPRSGLYFTGPSEASPGKAVQIWTQGQDEDSRYWFPCFDYPNEKATSETLVRVPENWTVVGNGRLVGVRHHKKAREKTWHHRMDTPHVMYLTSIACGEFSKLEDSWKGMPVEYYIKPGNEDAARRAFKNTPDMLEFFSRAFAMDYPYPKYSQVVVEDFIFGGMENISATTLIDRCLTDERAALDYEAEDLVSHELCHQWFGDLVTCKDWSHAWLNEGFATYGEYLYREHWKGRDDADVHRWEQMKAYFARDRQVRRPTVTKKYEEPMELFDAHIYNKGGLVLHMLRYVLGEDLFWKSIRAYLHAFAGKTVQTEDLIVVIEQETGRNLEWFFDEWIFGAGYPEFEVSFGWEDSSKTATLTVDQKQKLGNGAGLFRMPVVIRFQGKKKVTDRRVEVDSSHHVFTFVLPEKPVVVRFDPGFHIVKTLEFKKPLALMRSQLTKDPDWLGRAVAAEALAGNGSVEAVEALGKALMKEPFWGAAVEIASALGKNGSLRARDFLIAGLKHKHPKVRRAVAKALGAFRDDEAGSALAKAAGTDPSYFVEAEASLALGKTRAIEAFDVLKQNAAKESHSDVVRAYSLMGMAGLRDDRAFPILAANAAPGGRPVGRMSAMRALAELSKGRDPQRGEARLELEPYLRDEDYFARLGAMSALETLGEAAAAEAVETVRNREADSRLVLMSRRIARSLREGKTPGEELNALREDLEKIREENRSLKDRLEKVENRAAGASKRRSKPLSSRHERD